MPVVRFRSLGFLGGSSEKVIGIDVDLARIEWEKNLNSGVRGGKSVSCPGGMTSSVARPSTAGYPVATGRGFGRGAENIKPF